MNNQKLASKKHRKTKWGDIFDKYLAQGCDYAYAAYKEASFWEGSFPPKTWRLTSGREAHTSLGAITMIDYELDDESVCPKCGNEYIHYRTKTRMRGWIY